MNPICSLRATRSSIWQLPSHFRAAALTRSRPTARPFSCSPRTNIDAVSILTAPPAFLMDSLHALGMPWWLAIPSTAIVLRGIVVHNLITLPQRRRNNQQAAVTPLIEAYALKHVESDIERKRMERYYRFWYRRAPLLLIGFLYFQRVRGVWRGSREMRWLTGVRTWQLWGRQLGNIAVLAAPLEALRQKCGAGEGLLGLVVKPFAAAASYIERISANDSALFEQLKSILADSANDPGAARAFSGAGATHSELEAATVQPAVAPETMEPSPTPDADPDLLTEGLSWCPDLTIADPTGLYLPGALFLTIFVPSLFKPRSLRPMRFTQNIESFHPVPQGPRDVHIPELSKLSSHQDVVDRPGGRFGVGRLLKKFSLWFGLYFFFAAQTMPAGLVLYMICSLTTGFVQRVWVDVRTPSVKAIRPCSRPVRTRARGLQ